MAQPASTREKQMIDYATAEKIRRFMAELDLVACPHLYAPQTVRNGHKLFRRQR
jgi:hypothetical protein